MRTFSTSGCFACGRDNDGGLRMRIRLLPDGVACRFVPPRRLRGFAKIVHGGIHAVLLDEAIGVAIGHALGTRGATVALNVAYRRPMWVGQPVEVRARLTRRAGAYAHGRGEIVDADGRIVATASARIRILDQRLTKRFIGRAAPGTFPPPSVLDRPQRRR